jgi:hypothetical protein
MYNIIITTTIISLEPCALNADFHHFINISKIYMMDENWTTLVQLATWVKWITWMNFEMDAKLDHINTIGHIGEMNYMGWTLRMDENLTTLVQLAKCVKWITWMNFEMDENGPH